MGSEYFHANRKKSTASNVPAFIPATFRTKILNFISDENLTIEIPVKDDIMYMRLVDVFLDVITDKEIIMFRSSSGSTTLNLNSAELTGRIVEGSVKLYHGIGNRVSVNLHVSYEEDRTVSRLTL